MTQTLLGIAFAALIVGAVLFVWVLGFRFAGDRFALLDRIEPGSAGAIAVMFGLFLAFSTSDITKRSGDLAVSAQKEVSVARSIFQYTESIGASAAPVRQSLIEYLQAVTALEQTWLESSAEPVSPAQEMADTLVLVVTLFVAQSQTSAVLKSLILTKVDDLRQARTERIALSRKSSDVAQWIMLTVFALITQLVIALGYVGKPNSRRVMVGCFTMAAVTAMAYLAWNDGLIGPSRIALTMEPLKNFLAATTL